MLRPRRAPAWTRLLLSLCLLVAPAAAKPRARWVVGTVAGEVLFIVLLVATRS